VAAFAQLAAEGRGSNTCVYVIANFTMCERTEQSIAPSFVLKSENPQRKRINYCSKHTVKLQWVVHKCLVRSHVSATKEGAPGAKQNKGHVTGVF